MSGGSEPVRVVWAWRAMGPYHVARMRALAARDEVALTVVERFAGDPERMWTRDDTATEGFESLDWSAASARPIAAPLRNAEVIVVPGWAERDILRWGRELAGKTGAQLWVWSVSTERDRPRQWWREWAKRLRVGGFNGALAAGSRAADYLVRLGMSPDVIAQVGNAADPAPFVAAREAVASSPEPHDRPIVFAGRLIEAKNVDGLLRALGELVRAGGLEVPRLVVAGDGEERDRLRVLSAELDLSDRVEWLGETPPDQLARLLASARMLVLPSHGEPWGLVVNEAMHAGCPVVVTDICGCVPELAANADHAWIAPTSRPADLTAALRLALEATATPAARQAISASAVARAAEFTPERSADRIVEHLVRMTR